MCGKMLLMHAESCNVIIIKWDSAEHWSIISEHEVQSLLSSSTELCSHMYLNIWIPQGRHLLFYMILEELWQRESNTLHEFAHNQLMMIKDIEWSEHPGDTGATGDLRQGLHWLPRYLRQWMLLQAGLRGGPPAWPLLPLGLADMSPLSFWQHHFTTAEILTNQIAKTVRAIGQSYDVIRLVIMFFTTKWKLFNSLLYFTSLKSNIMNCEKSNIIKVNFTFLSLKCYKSQIMTKKK